MPYMEKRLRQLSTVLRSMSEAVLQSCCIKAMEQTEQTRSNISQELKWFSHRFEISEKKSRIAKYGQKEGTWYVNWSDR